MRDLEVTDKTNGMFWISWINQLGPQNLNGWYEGEMIE